jgi:hypothetical protein
MPSLAFLLGILFALPLLGAGAIFGVRRSVSLRHLASGILLSGVTGAILTACFGFTLTTPPIRLYEGHGGAWPALLQAMALFLYVGFGFGSVLASLLGIPVSLIASRARARRAKAEKPGE